jgi:hypothetical protein
MDATLVTAWKAVCQLLEPAFGGPTFITFLHITTGWVLCRSKPTVTNLVCTIGTSLLGYAAKHWTVYERFFYRAVWSLDYVSQRLLTQVVAPLVKRCATEAVIDLAIDDTTSPRYGKHVAYAGYFKDASASNTARTVVHWAHNWVVACVTLRPKRWPNWVIGLPVLFALYRKRVDCDRGHAFATHPQLAAGMISFVREILPDWVIRIAADGAYATRAVVEAASASHTNLVSRLRGDAALYALPPVRHHPRRGRKPKKGARLPSPKQLATRRRKGWRTIEARVYGRVVQRQVLSIECLWYHVSRDRPVKLLIVRDPAGKERDDFLFCTDPTTDDTEILERFAARWPIEECFRDAKQYGGFEAVQGWCPRTVERQAPMALIVQTLVKAWYLLHGVKSKRAQPGGSNVCGWLSEKEHPSYLDMLATLRRVLWNERINHNSTRGVRLRELWKTLQFTLCAAA